MADKYDPLLSLMIFRISISITTNRNLNKIFCITRNNSADQILATWTRHSLYTWTSHGLKNKTYQVYVMLCTQFIMQMQMTYSTFETASLETEVLTGLSYEVQYRLNDPSVMTSCLLSSISYFSLGQVSQLFLAKERNILFSF